MKLVILSGRSGSGKTIALHALEDQEFFCIDNLPLSMLQEFADKLADKYEQIAVSIDARSVPEDLAEFRKAGFDFNHADNIVTFRVGKRDDEITSATIPLVMAALLSARKCSVSVCSVGYTQTAAEHPRTNVASVLSASGISSSSRPSSIRRR